jgi:hypothetical protein
VSKSSTIPLPPTDDAVDDWRRRLIAWECALTHPWLTGDERVLLLCGVAVAVRCMHQLERDAEAHAPAGKVSEACLSKP